MHVGMYATTHGLMYRDNTNAFLRSMSASALQPVRIAQLIEQLGFHSMWFPDHVCMPLQSASEHVANTSGQRAYESHHVMLDAAVTMGAVAVSTNRLKLGTSVLISPYRHPLSDARQSLSTSLHWVPSASATARRALLPSFCATTRSRMPL